MKQYVILADACCDLSLSVREEIGMEDYIPGHVHVEDGRDFPFTLDWNEIPREEFYKLLSGKQQRVTTAPANAGEYEEKFESYAKRGIAVISMSLSSRISSTYQTACLAADSVRERYPDAKIYCFDTYRMSGGFGLLTVYAHLLKKEGKSFEEVVDWLEANKRSVHQMGPIDDLFFVARRGRITMGKAIMGSFAQIKPMGDCSPDGYTCVLANVRGIHPALDVTVRYISETATDPREQTILVAHSNREEYAALLAEKLRAELKPKKLFLTEVFSGCGANIGPGMVGVFYLGAPVSPDMEAERAVMNRILGK